MLQLLYIVSIGVVVSASPTLKTKEILAEENILKTAGDTALINNETNNKYSKEVLDQPIDNVLFKIPFTDYTVMLDEKKWDNGEVDVKLNFNSENEMQARKKSKIKKVFIPILVFILIKAIVLIPLALGVLGIKTWNAIQLSFISFVSSIVLGIWKLCSKINHDHPTIIHNTWDPHHHDRSDVTQQVPTYRNIDKFLYNNNI